MSVLFPLNHSFIPIMIQYIFVVTFINTQYIVNYTTSLVLVSMENYQLRTHSYLHQFREYWMVWVYLMVDVDVGLDDKMCINPQNLINKSYHWIIMIIFMFFSSIILSFSSCIIIESYLFWNLVSFLFTQYFFLLNLLLLKDKIN